MVEIQLPKKFSIRDLLKRGWTITSQNLGKIILLQLLFLLLFGLAFALIIYVFPSDEAAPPLSQLTNIFLSYCLEILFALGATNLALKFSNYETVKVSDFFSKWGRFPTAFFACILAGLAIFFGIFLLIIPGIFFAVRLSLMNFFIVDQNAGIFDSLAKSWNTVKGATWKVLGFLLICGLINLLGALCLGIGLLITYPVTLIASALLYRSLWSQSNVTVLADETPNELTH